MRTPARSSESLGSIDTFYEPTLYDLGAGDSDATVETVAYYTATLPLPRMIVLDIGAGSGRLSLPLLAAGHAVIALDQSTTMLSALTRKVEAFPDYSKRLTVVNAPFSRRSLRKPADAAIAPDDFLLHILSLAGLRQFFADLATWLRPGALFVTDVRHRFEGRLKRATSPPFPLQTFGLTEQTTANGDARYHNVCFWESYNAPSRLLQTTCHYHTIDGTGAVVGSHYRRLSQRIHLNREILTSAEQAGFRLCRRTRRNSLTVTTRCAIGGSLVFRREG